MINKIDNPLDNCELKFSKTSKGEFEGYASKFNGVDAVMDTIIPGAFKNTLKQNKKIPMFINHDSYSIPVGGYKHMEETKEGLLVVGLIDMNHKDGPSLQSALESGNMDALSIGFRIPANGAEEKENGIREIKEIDLKEISVVNFPADDAARIAVVKYDIEEIETLRDAEQFLRDVGYSKSAAKAFISRIISIKQRDADKSDDEIVKDVTESLVDFITKL